MLDTNQYDRLLAAPETYERLLRLLSDGKAELLTTHVQRDEIMAVEDLGKRARLEALLARARLIATRGIVVGLSRFDLARFGNDEDHNLIEHIRGEAWERKSEDALIAATAAKDADVFVTDDKSLARRLNSYPGRRCEVIDFEGLKRRLADLAL
jgi:predicted nucleic acid-binding protein